LWAQCEFLIDTCITYIPADYGREDASVAFDGMNYFVVWADSRNKSIIGTRVNQLGEVLDSAGIVICSCCHRNERPAVAFDGINYLVVWRDWRSDPNTGDIYGARVTHDGMVIDSGGFPICTAAHQQFRPAIAFNGINYFVVWSDSRSFSPQIYGSRITPDGLVIDTAGILISSSPSQLPSVVYDGVNFLVVWGDFRNASYDIYGSRVSQDGVVLDTAGIPIATASIDLRHPFVASDSTNSLVVWKNLNDIYGARVSQSGVVIDTNAIPISTAGNSQRWPAVAFDGMNYFVVWDDFRNLPSAIYGTRVTQTGIVLDTTGIPISSTEYSQRLPAVAFGDTNYLVVWEETRNDKHIFGARVNQSGTVLDSNAIMLSTQANYQRRPSVAHDGTNYFVVWHDMQSQSLYDIYGARVDSTGSILDTTSIPIEVANGDQTNPSVAFGNNNYLVVWWDYDIGGIYGARIGQDGTVLDTLPIVISDDGAVPSIAFDGINYLVVWCIGDIYGARISQSGVVIDTAGLAISTAPDAQIFPSISFDGTNYFVVWEDYRNSSMEPDIYGTMVSQSGTVLDTNGIAISVEEGTETYPTVAFDGANYLVVWAESYYAGIEGARVTPWGWVIGTTISIHNEGGSPAITFDGINYFIVWHEWDYNYYDICGAKVAPTGTVVDSFPILTQFGDQMTPAIAHGSGDQSLIAYSGWTGFINNRPANTMRIWGLFSSDIGIKDRIVPKTKISKFSLYIFPNPVRKDCNIKYSLSQKTEVNISLYDVTGRLIRKLINENQNIGVYQKAIDVSNLAQGVYFIRLNAENYSAVQKVILIK